VIIIVLMGPLSFHHQMCVISTPYFVAAPGQP